MVKKKTLLLLLLHIASPREGSAGVPTRPSQSPKPSHLPPGSSGPSELPDLSRAVPRKPSDQLKKKG